MRWSPGMVVIFYFLTQVVVTQMCSIRDNSCKCILLICAASVVSNSVRPHRWQPTRLLCPRDSLGKNTGVGCHALLQGIFSTQGSNTGLSHCRQILYCLSHQESPRIQEWVAYPFSRGRWILHLLSYEGSPR